MQLALTKFLKNAPLLAGAFFLLFTFPSCKEGQSETATWITSEPDKPVAETSPETDESTASKPNTTSGQEVRFLSYNLKNYLTMRRGKEYLPKPENEIKAAVALMARQKPDILGICEIGTKEDLLDLQRRLKNAGIDLPHYEHTGGRDKVRHLGLLSRYPIVETNSQSELSYEMNGENWIISRGILDATVETEKGNQLRLLGVHLKSKREINQADQELIRQNEARLLRNHMDAILEEDPSAKLVAYGDFNDTIKSKALSILRGRSNSKKHMPDFYFKDSRGELWTYFWDYQDAYSRFDYVLFSRSLRPHLVGKKSAIVDDEAWNQASDHRALMLVLKP